MYTQRGPTDEHIAVTTSFVLATTVLSYCELNICLFWHTPVYLIGTYILSYTRVDEVAAGRN
jgi:hypothetical protein